jgi:hypothetical protein
MAVHISVGLAQTGTPEKPEKAVRIAICAAYGNQDVEGLMSCADARMIAALLVTAADELQKQVVE